MHTFHVYINHVSLSSRWSLIGNLRFYALTGWSWGSCTPMTGRVGCIICSLQYHLRPERSRLSPAMYLQDSVHAPLKWKPQLYCIWNNIAECSWSSFISHHMLKWKTGFTTHVTHTIWNRPCQELDLLQNGSLPNLFQFILRNCH